jgi:hypothetical protein
MRQRSPCRKHRHATGGHELNGIEDFAVEMLGEEIVKLALRLAVGSDYDRRRSANS